MNLFKYIMLAIIQGFTEPLPISSSGHMKLFELLFTTKIFGDQSYEIICNFGSFLAIILIFGKDIIKLIKNFFLYIFNKDNRNNTKKGFVYCLYIIISTLPLVLSGIIYKVFDLENRLTHPYILGFAFLVTAFALYFVRNIKGDKDDYDITLKDAIIIGLFQAITFLPGISRSGTVLVACLICKLKRETALKYTFILYLPASLGSMLLEFGDILSSNISTLLLPYALGIIIAGVITYLSYEWMSDWVKRGKLIYFAIYCIILSSFIFIYFR